MTPSKLPPQNLDAERSVLGALLLDEDAIIKVVEFLMPDHFYNPHHRKIYEAALALFERRDPLDIVTITNELENLKFLEDVGGAAYLADLVGAVPTSAHVVHYAEIIRECATKRNLISVVSEIAESGFDGTVSASELLDQAEQKIFAISQGELKREFVPLRGIMETAFDQLDEMHKNPGKFRGVPTGFASLDKKIAGLQDSNLVIIASRPSVGKTSLSLNIAQHAAVAEQIPVGFFSLETSKEQLAYRMLAAQADVDGWRLMTGKLSREDFEKIGEAMGELAEAPLFIDDTPGIFVTELRTKARRLQLEHNVRLIVVDYLQLVGGRGLENRVQEVSELSQALKNLARELNIPVLVLSQLSRAVESRTSGRPQLSDLRSSGSIEQDADVVMFLYREDDENRSDVRLLIAKQRNGPTGEIPLYFHGGRTRFYEAEEEEV